MHKIFSIVLLLSVMVSSSGFMMTKHFCGEMLAHITLGDEGKTCCDDEEDMPNDCCHDESEQLLLDDFQLDHQTPQLQPLTFFTVSIVAHFIPFSSETSPASPLWVAFHAPPIPGIDVYLRIQSFLI
ncbi:MAG: hypothetical protein RIG62_27240 [Cyclobacteriaceae bacterium]